MTSLGGPGVACSAMRVRRLAAGELQGDDRARTEAHVAGCARCQETERALAAERVRLEADLPFEAFAAGVAERLAVGRPRPARRFRAVGLALAAGLAAAVAVPAALRIARDDDGRDVGARIKGAAELTVWVAEGGSVRALGAGDPVPRGATLRVGLPQVPQRFAAVALVDRDGVVVLHAGAAAPGPLPGAFEWTGEGEGTLVAVLDDRPVDGAALAARLGRGGVAAASPGGKAEVVVRPLRREAR
ncbi:MAG TPA: zf-HC2 domain-containing protein [Anaeromyxobacter sp.]|nr:zf-HC2 domain-containing protein [Anaeromyxobacter sp.]